MWLTAIAVACAGSYLASTVLPIAGLHDLLVPGARFRTREPGVALTFDDGPDPARTPVLLDLLAAARLRATFFVVGERAAAHPALVRRIAAEGHELGNHTWSHAWLPLCSSRRIFGELQRCQELVADLTGARPRLVRPPYGCRDARFYRAARELELTPVLWSIDTCDWRGRSPSAVLRRLRRAASGDIVLLHDGAPRARSTLPALERWLEHPDRPQAVHLEPPNDSP